MLRRNPEIEEKANEPAAGRRFNEYSWWSPRIWHGMSVSNWLSLLVEHGFLTTRIPMAAFISGFSIVNSTCNRQQAKKYREQAYDTPLVQDPIFILGHWRTGTTFLHSLFNRDERFWTPTTYECLSPEHFMVSEHKFPQLMQFPSRRPMDNMAWGWLEPQEDELALCTRGATSVYRNIAFPKHRVKNLESLTLENVSPRKLAHWKKVLLDFVRYLNIAHERPLVMKSPPHTGRVRVLLEMFPNAKFIHIARNPLEFIPSTIHLWKALEATNGLQRFVAKVDRENYVFDCFQRMYGGYERAKSEIPAGNLCQITYRDLTQNTLETMNGVYDHLSLGDFQAVSEPIQQYVDSKREYKRNQFDLPSALKARIEKATAEYSEMYLSGQASQPVAA